MSPQKLIKSAQSRLINTTVGEFVEAVYEAAMEEYMDEALARRIAMQVLLKRLRQQQRLMAPPAAAAPIQEKRALLRSELNRRRAVKKP